MDTSSVRFSFIIVNFQSARHLPACLSSLQNLSGSESFEVLVGNNDPSENHLLLDLKSRFHFEYTLFTKNDGFGTAANKLSRRARGKYLIFLNPDARILSGNLSRLSLAFEKNLSLGAIGFRLLVEPERDQQWGFGTAVSLLRIIMNHLLSPKTKPSRRNIFRVDWVSGGAFSIPRELFFRIHGFDERFFLYYEDVDLCQRLQKYGKKIALLREMRVLHLGSGSSQSSPLQKKIYFASQDRYFSLHRPFYESILLQGIRSIFKKKTLFSN